MFPAQRQLILSGTAFIVAATLLLALLFPSWSGSFKTALNAVRPATAERRQLHYLLPATAATLDFCRTLLSSVIAGYPDPILIGWGGHGKYDGAKSHLFKITEVLAYLNALPESNDHDLVLLVDAYDVVMLMPAQVMISRYLDLLQSSNERLDREGLFGRQHGGAEIHNTIFWGADKICWPVDWNRPACWAVPASPMRGKAFGPHTDSSMTLNLPRWLNSGTVIGPVKDMRDMFKATVAMLEREYDESFRDRNSDQYYFQDVWAEQEIARKRFRGDGIRAPVTGYDDSRQPKYAKYPNETVDRTEYHIAMDYNSILFQTAAGYREYLTWMSFNHTTNSPPARGLSRLDQLLLPADLELVDPPFGVSNDMNDPDNEVKHLHEKGWKDVVLGVNVVTQQAFPLLHYTGDKGMRNTWWPQLWFHPYGDKLLRARQKAWNNKAPQAIGAVGGVSWTGANTSWVHTNATNAGGIAWTDQGLHLSWEPLCAARANELFLHS